LYFIRKDRRLLADISRPVNSGVRRLEVFVDTVCQSCSSRIDIPYILLGAAMTCHECGVLTIPQALPDSRPPDTGYQITFSDFHQLLSYPGYRASIAPLLRDWFGYELEMHGDSVCIQTHDGKVVDELTLHQKIQDDELKQSALYRAAMTLWR
jgi:hypothetical protein